MKWLFGSTHEVRRRRVNRPKKIVKTETALLKV